MKCSVCGKDYEDGYQFCPFCGQKNEVPGTFGDEVMQEAAAPPAGVVVTPPVPPSVTASSAPGGKKSISDRWRGLSTKGKVLVIGIGVFLLLVVIIGPISGTNDSKESDVAGKPAVSDTREPEKEEAPEKSVDEFITITNVSDGQQLAVGPSVIAGTAKEDCTITCNGQPVGFAPGTMDFAPTVTINEGPNAISFVVTDKNGKTYAKDLALTGILSPETYKAVSPAGPPFANLNKNPDAYKGTRCQYKGKVVQIMEGAGTSEIRMDITPMGYGYWTDTIYVTYDGTTPAVEENIIIVYGTIMGSYSYTSQANYNITLPLIEAKYVDVVQ